MAIDKSTSSMSVMRERTERENEAVRLPHLLQTAEIIFLQRVAWLSFIVGVRSLIIPERIRVERLLLHIEKSQLSHLIQSKMPYTGGVSSMSTWEELLV